MIKGIKGMGGKLSVGAVRFKEYSEAPKSQRALQLQRTQSAFQLLDLQDTKSGIQSLREAFQALEDLKPNQMISAGTAAGGGVEGGAPKTRTVTLDSDYKMTVTRAQGVSPVVGLNGAEDVDVGTKIARLRTQNQLGETSADRVSFTLARSVLDGLSSGQLASQRATAVAQIGALHTAMLQGKTARYGGQNLGRDALARAVYTVEFADAAAATGDAATSLSARLGSAAQLGALAKDAGLQSAATGEIAGLDSAALAQSFAEVTDRLQSFDPVALQAAPSGPVDSQARDGMVQDLARFDALVSRMATLGGGGSDQTERVRIAFGIGTTAADVTLAQDSGASLEGLSRDALLELDAQATATLDAAALALDGAGGGASLDRGDIVLALKIKERIAGTEASQAQTYDPSTTGYGADVEDVVLDAALGHSLSLTGDPDDPTGFALSVGVDFSMNINESFKSMATRHEALGLAAPIQAGSFEFMGHTINVSESQSITDVGMAIFGALAGDGIGFSVDFGAGKVTFSGALTEDTTTIGFGSDTSGFLSAFGLDGLGVTIERPTQVITEAAPVLEALQGGQGNTGTGLGPGNGNGLGLGLGNGNGLGLGLGNGNGLGNGHGPKVKFSHKHKVAQGKGMKLAKEALKSLKQSAGLASLGTGKVGAGLQALATALDQRNISALSDAAQSLETLANDAQFVEVIEALQAGGSMDDLARMLGARSTEGKGTVQEIGLQRLTQIEDALSALLAA